MTVYGRFTGFIERGCGCCTDPVSEGRELTAEEVTALNALPDSEKGWTNDLHALPDSIMRILDHSNEPESAFTWFEWDEE